MSEQILNRALMQAVTYTPQHGAGAVLNFAAAAERIKQVVNKTPLVYNHHLSRKHNCR